MNRRAAEEIGLISVLEDISKHTVYPGTARYITENLFTSDESVIKGRAEKIAGYTEKLEKGRVDAFPDINPLIEYAEMSGMAIPGRMIRDAGEFISSYISMNEFIGERTDPSLVSLSEKIFLSLDSNGVVREDNPRVGRLIEKRNELVRARLLYARSYMSDNAEYVTSDEPMYRNLRVVIPMTRSASSREHVIGASSSGETVFAEPGKILEMNNNVVIAESAIEYEKAEILRELSSDVRCVIDCLKKAVPEVIDFDFHCSFALWAESRKVSRPNTGEYLFLSDAVNPLLGPGAVPITINTEGAGVLVISGANAGGKTVTMKTIALIVSLNQIYGFVTASEDSRLPLFSNIFTDIGDGQSIEDGYSTFSCHMEHIAEAVNESDSDSLVVLDELGTGTDIEEGSALSFAILRYLSKKVKLVSVTTHLSSLKALAYSDEGMMNASMGFDPGSDEPTFKVREGLPGESHAFKAALRAGIPEGIVKEAERTIGEKGETASSVIARLLKKEAEIDEKKREIIGKEKENDMRASELTEAGNLLRLERDELRKNGISEIKAFLSSSAKTLENLVADIKTGRKGGVDVKEFEKSVRKKIEEEEGMITHTEISEEFNLGDYVTLLPSRSGGTVSGIDDGGVRVILDNGMKINIKAGSLKKTERKGTASSYEPFRKGGITTSLDLRGRTADQAIEEIEKAIDAALAYSPIRISIIHGYGTLSAAIHKYLSECNVVKSYSFAEPGDGGRGKTYLEI